MSRRRIATLTAAATLALTGAYSSNASADHHLIKVSEVHNGAAITGDYAELQMYADGQNLLGGHYIRFLDEAGAALAEYPLPNVAFGETQRTVLVGNTGVAGADFTNAGVNVKATGGAVCWNTLNLGMGGIDCATWGNFAGVPSSAAGNPAPALGADQSLQRTLAPGCATLLEEGDDSNNSAVDFALGTPTPRNNATAPTERPCVPCKGQTATMVGTEGADTLTGTAGKDVVSALGGNDTVSGLNGKDVICGGDGKDKLNGGNAKDTILGGAGKDSLNGGNGKDSLLGQGGKDTCKGGKSDDTAKKCEVEEGI
jgi:Ca2+-binding RTX toxin-like protein